MKRLAFGVLGLDHDEFWYRLTYGEFQWLLRRHYRRISDRNKSERRRFAELISWFSLLLPPHRQIEMDELLPEEAASAVADDIEASRERLREMERVARAKREGVR